MGKILDGMVLGCRSFVDRCSGMQLMNSLHVVDAQSAYDLENSEIVVCMIGG